MTTHTAIICTRNRNKDIVNCLQSLAAQSQTFDQLIVVDSSDTPLKKQSFFSSLFTSRLFGNTQLLYLHTKPGLPYQRNCGIKKATGDIVYFFDDDATVASDYVKQMAAVFDKHPECAGGMGEITNMPSQSNWSYYFYRFFGLHGRDATGDFTCAGMTKQAYGARRFRYVESLNGCAAYRRDVFVKYLFDSMLPGRAALEDADMSWRIGREHKMFFTPAAKLQHDQSTEGRESMQQFHTEHMRNYSYFFFKNVWPTGKWKIVAYLWAVCGLFIHGMLKRDGAELRGYCQGLYEYYWLGVLGK